MDAIEWAMHNALQADRMAGQLIGHIFDLSRSPTNELPVIGCRGDIQMMKKYLNEVEKGLDAMEVKK
jgi:hypothetical protein